MPLPTLLIKGALVAYDGTPATQARLNEFTPIDYVVEWFKSRLGRVGVANRVVIVKAETASGKSTAIPAYLYRDVIRPAVQQGDKRGLIITQPKILTAIENVKEMLKIPAYADFLKLGRTIGWSTGPNKLRAENYGMLSATVGTLAQQLRTLSDEEFMDRYRIVLIDETHERDVQTDLTIYMLKSLIARQETNPRCPFLALMSATFDPDPLLRYFGITPEENFIWCKGATARIDEIWDRNLDAEGKPKAYSNYIRAAADTVDEICRKHTDDPADAADILIFMPGEQEIKATALLARGLNEKYAREGLPVMSILRMDSGMVKTQGEDYKLMLMPLEHHEVSIGTKKYKPLRRLIITTVVAETGLTLDNLKYVIDAGYSRETEYNPIYGTQSLLTKPAPQSRIRQRRGRVGRKFDGYFYPLYPKFVHEKLPLSQYPAILTSDSSALVLDIAHEQLRGWLQTSGSAPGAEGPIGPPFDPFTIDMIDPPTSDSLRVALEKCHALGFISTRSIGRPVAATDIANIGAYPTRDGLGLTPLGACARCVGGLVSLESMRMIFAGLTWGASLLDLVSIAAFLQIASGGDIVMAAPEIEGKKQPKYSPDWDIIYRAGLPKMGTFTEGEGVTSRARSVLADNFIDLLVINNAVLAQLVGREPFTARENLAEWCRRVKLDHRAMIASLEMREKLIEAFLAVGIGIYSNESAALILAPEREFMNAIVRLKYCIYEGFRLNMITNGNNSVYTTRQGLQVTAPSIYTPAEVKKYGATLPTINAQRYLYAKLKMVAPRPKKSGAVNVIGPYTVMAELLSAMDGYVAVDTEFTE